MLSSLDTSLSNSITSISVQHLIQLLSFYNHESLYNTQVKMFLQNWQIRPEMHHLFVIDHLWLWTVIHLVYSTNFGSGTDDNIYHVWWTKYWVLAKAICNLVVCLFIRTQIPFYTVWQTDSVHKVRTTQYSIVTEQAW